MAFSISATTVKYYFQYRCERQVRYRMAPAEVLESVPVSIAPNETEPWARAGDDYEARVVACLAKVTSVLRPTTGQRSLSASQTLAFLREPGGYQFAHQMKLELPDRIDVPLALARRWGLPSDVSVAVAMPDLVEAVTAPDGSLQGFRIIDIKAVNHATLFHRAQVAYYAMLLEAILELNEIDVAVLPEAEIWHVDVGPGDVPLRARFRLAGYKAQVTDFLSRVVPRLATVRVEPGRDDTRFHVYFKCEQCPFLPHCRKVVAPNVSAAALDLSAIPGMSWQTKYTLVEQIGVRLVGDLATRGIEGDVDTLGDLDLRRHPMANWSLRSSGDVLVRRARALTEHQVTRLPNRFTHAMPSQCELGIYLVADHDPIEGRLATLGCRFEWRGGPSVNVIEPISLPGASAERSALVKVLGAVVTVLSKADAHNAANPDDPIRAHLFLYEPSEATDIAAALGRHLENATVRGVLLHMLRIFPPDGIAPEPQYKGSQHLPATSLRSVIDDLFALPARVSHDLRTVTSALAAADPPLKHPYNPGEAFVRPYSSRLNISACQELKAGRLSPDDVATDVSARLQAMASLAEWLAARNTMNDGGFLRLKKEPFRWQATLDPLSASDIDLIRAHELLKLRVAEVQALVALAAPWQVRRDRRRCFARMRLVGVLHNPTNWIDLRLRLFVPPESRKTELESGTLGLILTNDDPDLRLDPRAWLQVFVNLREVVRRDGGMEVVIDVQDAGPLWKKLLRETAVDGWFLDQAHRDLNGDRVDSFLRFLGDVPGTPGRDDVEGGVT